MDLISLDINLRTVIVQWISTLILFLVAARFFVRPMRIFLDKRREFIEAELVNAQNVNDEAVALKEQADSELKKIKEEASQMLEDADARARAKSELILADAKEEAALEIDKGRERIKREREEMYYDAKKDIARIANDATAKLIKKEIDQTIHDDLFDEFVRLVGGADDE